MKCDFLIIGSGLSGLLAAIKLAPYGRVLLTTKRTLEDGATEYAQGGIASVTHQDDTFDDHVRDTLKAGAGLCEKPVVSLVVAEGPARVRELIDYGVHFSLRSRGDDDIEAFDLGLEGGHSHRRILHVKDMTGKAIHDALIRRVRALKNVHVMEQAFAIDLLSSRHHNIGSVDACYGAYVLDQKKQRVETISASVTILATGGAGKTYLYTSNPDVSTGDGMAMAFRAGVPLANLEFVQFHPTCLYHPYAKSFLISEAVRGEGGVLTLRSGETFMKRYHPDAELAPRDIVARAIDKELKARGEDCVYLDIRKHKPAFIRRRFPAIYKKCLDFGIDITQNPIPVVPAAHYFCGGVMVDHWGQTALPRLFAVGEVAYTGLHGANRLASNSLLECVVFAHRAAQRAIQIFRDELPKVKLPLWNRGEARDPDEQVVISQNWDEIRRIMWNYVGIERSDKRLARALRRMELLKQEIQEYYWDFIVTPGLLELRNLSMVAEMVIRSALARQESRGLHSNRDHPRRNDRDWKKISIVTPAPVPTRMPTMSFRAI